MLVKEAKEIIATMDLSDKTLDKATEMLLGMMDTDELPEVVLDKLLALIDQEGVNLDDEISDEEVLEYIEKKNPVVKNEDYVNLTRL